MPLPFMAAVGAAAVGAGSAAHGAVKMKEAQCTMEKVHERHQRNQDRLRKANEYSNGEMDRLGTLELRVLDSFKDFSDTIGKIQNRPQFKEYRKEEFKLPAYDIEELKKVSVGAGMLLGGLGGAVLGTAGGIVASGAVTSAVIAFGTASTGTAIASLSGAAATNAALAAIGGGAVAAGGGGVALGTSVLSAASLGVGILVGGTVFNIVGIKLSEKADEAYDQMEKAERTANECCSNLSEISKAAKAYRLVLADVWEKYLEQFEYVSVTVNRHHKEDWNMFSEWEKKVTQNAILLVGLLYKMCNVSFLTKDERSQKMRSANMHVIGGAMKNAEQVLNTIS